MATLTELVTRARYMLNEPVASFWSDAELISLLNSGISDLWRRTKDLYQDYYYTVDTTNVSLAASASSLTGVPSDVAVVCGLEPRSLSTHSNLRFVYKHYMDAAMQSARAAAAMDPSVGGTIFYAVIGAGAPIAAPSILTAPTLTAAVPLTLTYIPTLTTKVGADANPIPGQSDQALVNWVLAHTIDKDKDSAVPNLTWMGRYEDEVTKICIALAPRQEADLETAEAFFEPYWS